MKKSTTTMYAPSCVRQSKCEQIVLWVLACMGSQEAMDKFLLACTAILKKWTWKSDDACQEALMLVWQDIAGYDPSKWELSTWLYQKARGGWRNAKRKQAKESLLGDDPDGGAVIEQVMSLDDSVKRQEELDVIIQFLAPEDLEIISKYFIDGMTFAQIGKELNVSGVYVRKHVLAIVNTCRKHFGTKGEVTGLSRHGMKYHNHEG